MALFESGEMYLETIYILSQKNPIVRGIDISKHMGHTRPSVSRAVNLLKKEGFINIDNNDYISLTETGKKEAMQIYEKHTVLTKILMKIGVDEKTATEDACRIEHYISDKTFEIIKSHIEKCKI